MFTLDNVRKCLRGGLISALLILLVSCAFDNNAEAGMRIQIINSFESSKTISADSSITGGNSSIDILGLEISTEDGSKVLYSNDNLAEDVVYLQDIVAGTYRFTVKGYISGGATPILVAETPEVHEVGNGSTLSLTLKDPIEGNISGFSFKVYAPYTGEYSHVADELTIRYSEGEDVILSVSDGTLSYAGEESDENGSYWSYNATATGLAKIKVGKCLLTFKAEDTEGNESVCSETAMFFAGLAYTGEMSGQKGANSLSKLPTPQLATNSSTDSGSLVIINSNEYTDLGVTIYFDVSKSPDFSVIIETFTGISSSLMIQNTVNAGEYLYVRARADGFETSDIASFMRGSVN